MTLSSLFCALAFTVPQGGTPPSYRVDFLGDGSSASALNEAGVVVGWVTLASGVNRAAVSYDGEPLATNLLPLPPGFTSSQAYDVNESGLIVGVVSPTTLATLQPHAAAWFPSTSGYTVQVLGEPAGDLYSNATGVNDLGDIVGSSGTTPWSYWVHGVHFSASGPVVLPGFDSAVDVNDNRNVLSSRGELFDLDTQVMQTIPLPPGNWMGFGGAALNELDAFCGYIQGFSSTCASFPIRWMPSVGWTFVGGCAQTTSATAINDLGDVLQYVYQTNARVQFEGIGQFTIGELIDPSQGNWYVQYWGASDINNSRQMLCGVRDATLTLSGAARLTDMNVCGSSTVAMYCTPKTSSSGCVPSITTSGEPSASTGSGFHVSASQVETAKLGLFFYGTHGRLASPFQGGFLCVKAPLKRLSPQSSGGSGACAGALDYDFNAWIATGLDPALVGGATVDGQFWFRDPSSPSTTGLSGGVEFVLCN
ncbi:MAG: hypothetical protein IT453_07395 [Planctomycetes bacterium]|nr:hypothetical protein [Planctomycetota bacterium]